MDEITTIKKNVILKALEEVKDPEIPVLSVVDLGIIEDVVIEDEDNVTVYMVPTFTGCPAIDLLRNQIQETLNTLGFKNATVVVSHDSQWSTDRMTEEGREKLRQFGIAPPPDTAGKITTAAMQNIACPYCGSRDTVLKSLFGSTLCRAIHYCNHCKQSFERFKPL